MKRIATISLSLLLLSSLNGCGNFTSSTKDNTQNEVVNTIPEIKETEIYTESTNETNETNKTQEPEIYTIEQIGPYGTISISLSEEWNYKTYPIDNEDLFNGLYGIRFYPKDAPEGFIELVYTDWFGVCGTGLASKDATIAGDAASIGTYDNQNYWSFISFKGKNEGIVALAYSVDSWWDTQSDNVLAILNTLSFNRDLKEGGAYVYKNDSEISEIALSLSLKNISSTGATIIFNQYDADAPAGELSYGADYLIEVYKDGNWENVSYNIENYAFDSLAYIIPTDSISEYIIDWNSLYGALPAGEYRIIKEISELRETGKYNEYKIYANFILN